MHIYIYIYVYTYAYDAPLPPGLPRGARAAEVRATLRFCCSCLFLLRGEYVACLLHWGIRALGNTPRATLCFCCSGQGQRMRPYWPSSVGQARSREPHRVYKEARRGEGGVSIIYIYIYIYIYTPILIYTRTYTCITPPEITLASNDVAPREMILSPYYYFMIRAIIILCSHYSCYYYFIIRTIIILLSHVARRSRGGQVTRDSF